MNSLTPLENYPADLREVVDWAKNLFGCATARISTFDGQPVMFLVIGWARHTRDLPRVVWRNEDGERIDFSYTEEQAIASGDTVEELKASAAEYHRITQLRVEEFSKEWIAKKP